MLDNVSKIFEDENNNTFYALKNISMQIGKNECILLDGESGSGKTTLLHIVASLMKPTEGLVRVDGKNIVSLSDYHASNFRRSTIGYVSQSFYLLDALSVEENLLPSLVFEPLSTKQQENKIHKALALAKIDHKAKQKTATLSGGEKQRCVIARAIVNNPDIILCDEPTANLDKENSLHFLELIRELKKMGKTILIATHDPLFHKLECVDKIIHMKDGSFE
jgi:putative ABC transport system ATP-binding protein